MSKYQDPKFDKSKYWKRRNNTTDVLDKEGQPVKEKGKKLKQPKPLRGQGDYPERIVGMTPSPVTIGFNNEGQMVVQNRAWRRQRVVLPGDEKPKQKKAKRKKRK